MLLSAFARGQAAVEREVLAGIDVGPETRALIEEAVSLSAFPDVAALVKNGEYFGDEPAGSTSVPLDPEAEADAILEFAVQVLIAGLESTLEDIPLSHTSAPTPPPSTPQEAYEASEARLRQHKELRKQAQQRLREMEREEATLQKARDRAKELAKAHAKLAQG
jgi:type IV secretory pathway VirB10-like protein